MATREGMNAAPPSDPRGAPSKDTVIAARSAITLGTSLVGTWSVALVVRFFLPRYLGPEQFGVFNFADAFAATCFIALGLGVDIYIQKVIPVRPAHASDFFGGVLVARLLMSAGVFAVMAVLMALAGRPAAVQRIVFVFGAAQMLVVMSSTLAALLHASRNVGGLAFVNIASKVLWAGAVGLAVLLRLGLVGLAFAFLASEGLRALALSRLVRKHVGLRLRFDAGAVKLVILASLPMYLNQVANTIYGKVDVSMLSVLSNDTEIGWYGTASNLASLALLASPLLGWVLLPLLSRAASRSSDELFAILRRAIAAILLLVLPISLMVGLGADVWIPGIFGPAFAPATLSLRILSPIFVCTYLAMISATCLVLLDRAWTVALVSLVALVVNPTLNLLLVPWMAGRLGAGGAGAGAAIALLLTEMGVATALTAAVGREAFDRESASSLGKALVACALVVGLDRALAGLGGARLAVDAAAYVALIFATRAARLGEVVHLARFLLERRQNHAPS